MAGRIPQDFIDDLLHRTDIVDVVEERVGLKRAGRNYSGLCPFHKEKTPSFSVNPEKQFYYCFGCGAGGNALGFVMEHDRLDFPQAVETLARRLGLEVPEEQGGRKRDSGREQSYDLLQRTAAFFQQQLRQHPERTKAVDYLKGRGLSGKIAQQFGIGYAPPGWDNLISHLKAAEPAQQQALDKAGLVILKPEDNKCYDRFRDRIMFPIVDMRGRVIAFGGRVLTDEKPKYLNSPETDCFHKNRELYGLYQARQANRDLQRVLIVEGYMDVVALAQFGITNAVATLGTATSEHHLTRLYKLVPEVVFCFDGDAAGRQAARRALETALPLMEDGRQARFLFLPEGEDPDSMIRREGTDAFRERIEQGRPLSAFFFEALGEGIDIQSGEGRARLSALAVPLIERIPGSVFQQIMRQQLSELAGVDSHFFDQRPVAEAPPAIHDMSTQDWEPEYYPEPEGMDYSPRTDNGRQRSWDNRKRQPNTGAPRAPIRTSSLGTKALRRLLHNPPLALKVDFETTDALGTLQEPELNLLKALIEQLRANPTQSTALLLLDWQGTDYYDLLRRLAEEELLGGENQEQTFIDCLHQLVAKTTKLRIDELKRKNREQRLQGEDLKLFNKLLLQQRPAFKRH